MSASWPGLAWPGLWLLGNRNMDMEKQISSSLTQDVLGCNVSPVSGFQPPDESLVYLCYAVSKEDGSFSFYSLPSGAYTVVSD